MKKKIMALVLAASMITVPFATAYASERMQQLKKQRNLLMRQKRQQNLR